MSAQICKYCKHKNDWCYCSPNSTCDEYEPDEKERKRETIETIETVDQRKIIQKGLKVLQPRDDHTFLVKKDIREK